MILSSKLIDQSVEYARAHNLPYWCSGRLKWDCYDPCKDGYEGEFYCDGLIMRVDIKDGKKVYSTVAIEID